MKRKLATKIKGTPVITKFFKKSSVIDVKTATVKTCSPSVPKSKTNCDSRIPLHDITQQCKGNVGPGVEDRNNFRLKCCVVKVEPLPKKNVIVRDEGNQIVASNNLKTSELPTLEEKDLVTSSSNENLKRESKTTTSCEEKQELVELSTNKEAYSSLGSSCEITPCDVQETVNGSDLSTSSNAKVTAKMEDLSEMETSDSQTVIDSELQENGNEEKLLTSDVYRERSEETTLTSSTAKTKSYNMSSEEHLEDSEDDEDESDDELLCPPAFLCDYRVKPEITTPEKCTVPLTGSPLSQVSPFIERQQSDRVKCRYSLAKLVLEKPKQVKKDQEMARLQLAIQEQIEKGRMARLAGDTSAESEDDDETILPIHQKELDKFISKDKEFAEEIPGEDIFPEFKEPVKVREWIANKKRLKHENGCSQVFPTLNSTRDDKFAESLPRRSDVEIQELLCGGWITQRYLVRPCPQNVVKWLFHILSYHLDSHTVQASYNCLWSLLNAEPTKGKQTRLSWIPDIQDMLHVFYNYGANVTSLPPKVQDKMDSSEHPETSSVGEGYSSVTLKETQNLSSFPLVNLTRLIQFITLCVLQSPGQYNTKGLEHLIVSLYCLSLDRRLDLCVHDIKTCLEAAYGAFQHSQWPYEALKLSSLIYRRETHHRNKLHLVHMQPYSCRGRDVKRLASMQTLACLASNGMSAEEVKDVLRPDVDESKDKEVTDASKSFEKLEKLLHQLRVKDDTDYYKLYTIIELLDLAVGAESLLPPEKVILERITGRLRVLNNDIKDPRAMFISRTKVKDLILRTISKFVFMAQGKKETQRSVSVFFEDAKSDLFIETLKETEEPEENVESETEKSFGSNSDQDCFSPISDIVDESEDTTRTSSDVT